MESPTLLPQRTLAGHLPVSETSNQTIIDEESIAFGVMYNPRARIQRLDELNYDTRLLREGTVDERDFHPAFIEVGQIRDDIDL